MSIDSVEAVLMACITFLQLKDLPKELDFVEHAVALGSRKGVTREEVLIILNTPLKELLQGKGVEIKAEQI